MSRRPCGRPGMRFRCGRSDAVELSEEAVNDARIGMGLLPPMGRWSLMVKVKIGEGHQII